MTDYTVDDLRRDLSDANPGDTITVPPGTYELGGVGLYVPEDVELLADGATLHGLVRPGRDKRTKFKPKYDTHKQFGVAFKDMSNEVLVGVVSFLSQDFENAANHELDLYLVDEQTFQLCHTRLLKAIAELYRRLGVDKFRKYLDD